MSVKLSNDVLTEIIRLVHDTERPTIFSLSLVNRGFHSLSIRFVYRECTFMIDKNGLLQAKRRIQDWLDPDGPLTWVPTCIHQITLLKTDYDKSTGRRLYTTYTPDKKTWTPIAEFLPHLINLDRFVFSCVGCQFPSKLLETLEKHRPNVHLIVRDWNLGSGRPWREIQLDNEEETLARSPLLRELGMFNTYAPHDVSFQALARLVTLAPKLEKLVIDRVPDYRIRGYCGNARHGEYETKNRAAEVFKLKSDELAAMKPRNSLTDLRLLEAPEDFVHYCLSAFNMKSLQTFHSNFPLFWKKVTTSTLSSANFDSLRHLNLWLKGGKDEDSAFEEESDFDDDIDSDGDDTFSSTAQVLTARRFLLHLCPPHKLESLTLRSQSPIAYLPSILKRHGSPTLRSLTLGHDLPVHSHPKPTTASPFHPSTISTLISDECSSSLTQLALCVSRVDERDNNLLTSFGRFKRLQHLTLDFGSGLNYIQKLWRPGQDLHLCTQLEETLNDEEKLEQWELDILNLQMPMSTNEVEGMFLRVWESGCKMLETLKVKMRHPFGDTSEQIFFIRRLFPCNDEKLKLRTTIDGYKLPTRGWEGEVYKFDPKVPRFERLKKMWMVVAHPQESFPDWAFQKQETTAGGSLGSFES
ncbi:hypothetical protein DL96DRAFT_1623461 [Flagelloscypha sp. PMI_526]|nr:hypothetical protein DL96DRAFT_1623461 [Flagelloscypha sp. PMI_526]